MRVSIFFAVFSLSLLFPYPSESASVPGAFAGRVVIASNTAVSNAKIKICQQTWWLVSCSSTKSNSKGHFISHFNPAGGPLRITATGGQINGQRITYKLVRSDYRPNQDGFAWVSPETTVVDLVRKKAHKLSKPDAEQRVMKVFGLSKPTDLFKSGYSAYYYYQGLVTYEKILKAAMAVKGFSHLMNDIANTSLASDPTPFFTLDAKSRILAFQNAPLQSNLKPRILLSSAGQFIASGLAEGALGEIGGLPVGWILNALSSSDPSSQLQQMSEQLSSISTQIDNLSSEVSNLSLQVNNDFSLLTQQIAGLQNQLNSATVNQIFDSTLPCISQLETLTQDYAALTSQAAEPTITVSGLKSLSSALLHQIVDVSPSAQTCLNELPQALIPPSPLNSFYFQYAAIITNSQHPVLNQTGSSLIQNQFSTYYDWIVTAETMAITGAQYHSPNTPLTSTFITAQQAYQTSSNSIMPQPLPANTAVQVAANQPSAGFNGQFMWATGPIGGINAGIYGALVINPPLYPLDYSGFLQSTWLYRASITGATGLVLTGWYGAPLSLVNKLLATNNSNTPAMTFFSGLLGLDPTYANIIATSGLWDSGYYQNQTCYWNSPNYGPLAVAGFISTTTAATSVTCGTSSYSPPPAAYIMYRPVTTSEVYLPIN